MSGSMVLSVVMIAVVFVAAVVHLRLWLECMVAAGKEATRTWHTHKAYRHTDTDIDTGTQKAHTHRHKDTDNNTQAQQRRSVRVPCVLCPMC